MTNVEKVCIWVFVLTVMSITGIKWVYSQEALVEHSIAYQKNKAPQRDLNQLFTELGISYPIRANPCFDIEEFTRKYCTVHAMKLVVDKLDTESNTEVQLYLEMSLMDDGCEQAALYIGRVCKQENFIKIFKHFALKK